MASASSGATDSWAIFGFSFDCAESGMVFSTTTCSSTDSVIWLLAALLKRPCEANANTRLATMLLSYHIHLRAP